MRVKAPPEMDGYSTYQELLFPGSLCASLPFRQFWRILILKDL